MKHYKMINITRSAAYTLIQLMFMIAVITATTAFTYSYANRDFVDTKNDKTALEMQRIMEMAIIYLRKESEWPSSMNDLVSKNYTSDKLKNNPYGFEYSFERPDGATGERFVVVADIPNGISRDAFTSLLPSADISHNPTISLTKKVKSTITSAGKDPEVEDGPILRKIHKGYNLSIDDTSKVKICFAEEVDTYNYCKQFNRVHAVLPSISGFNAGSIFTGYPVGYGAASTI